MDEAYESIAKLLDAMQEEWEEVSEKFRYQDQSDLMYEIVDNFLQNRLSQDRYLEDQSQTDGQRDSNLNRYMVMNRHGSMEEIQEEEDNNSLI